MEYTEWKTVKKQHRRRLGSVGWILLIYYVIMNVCVLVFEFGSVMVSMIRSLAAGDLDALSSVGTGTSGAWGYFLAAAIGMLILLCWKKRDFWKNQIWARGRPMKMGDFLILLSLFFSGQLVYQLVMTVVELILNCFGLSVLKGMAAVSMDMENFSMFLYGGILAPVTEELLFRGLVQRTLQPYGKRFAILCSAFTFGIFHGNLLQAPYAFLVGLVLGYVASEYSIAWAMLLHMLNNLVLGDMLPRLTGGLPEYVSGLILFAVLIPCAVVSVVMLVVKRESIRTYRRENPVYGYSVRCFFSSGGIITLMVLMGISMIASIFIMVGPM